MDKDQKAQHATKSLADHLREQGIAYRNIIILQRGGLLRKETYFIVVTTDESTWDQIPQRWEDFAVEAGVDSDFD